MRLSTKELAVNIDKEIREMLFQVIADAKDEEEVKTLLMDLLTEAEQVAVAKRLGIALFLKKGKSYEEIKDTLKVSSATIAKVQEDAHTPGMKLALQKIQADQWAEAWASKLSKLLGGFMGK